MRNILSFILGLVLSTIMLLWSPKVAPAATRAADSIRKKGATVVAVRGEERVAIGSAFAIKDGDQYRLYTAQHVGLLWPYLQICSTEWHCVDIDGTKGVGPIVSQESVDDWMYWQVDELPYGLEASKVGNPAKVGESVCVTGAPLGRSGEVTCGQVTNVHGGYIYFDARVEPGNSGGPLLDARGRVIGLVVSGDLVQGQFIASAGNALPVDSLLP